MKLSELQKDKKVFWYAFTLTFLIQIGYNVACVIWERCILFYNQQSLLIPDVSSNNLQN